MKHLAIELLGGPHDGYSIDCLLMPPPYFLLPTTGKNIASVYYFECVCFTAGGGRLNYQFSGYQAITSAEMQELSSLRSRS
ncbi:MAG: hypothetical protein C0508_12340 [Cyanobacteria bacterium PR.023]|nr:hypothetical protein [Cyanobacteria bacterium PR.023]